MPNDELSRPSEHPFQVLAGSLILYSMSFISDRRRTASAMSTVDASVELDTAQA